MAGRLAIRRLRLAGLAPRDHPEPDALADRMAAAARSGLAPALARLLPASAGQAVLRIRRLEVDVTAEGAFDAEAFASLLARAICRGVSWAGEADGAENIVVFASRPAYLAAVVEALAAGRAARSWWLREAVEGIRFLSAAAAIRTALLAAPADAQAALASLSPARLAKVVAALGTRESLHVLEALAATIPDGQSDESAVAAIAAAATAMGDTVAPLALYVRACVAGAGGGRGLAEVAVLWARTAAEVDRPAAGAVGLGVAGVMARPDGIRDDGAADRVQQAVRQRLGHTPAGVAVAVVGTGEPSFSRFAGLLLLVPGLPVGEMGALIGYATLGLCGGRARFGGWLREPVWRELFGLDVRATASELAARLAGIDAAEWQSLAPLGLAPETTREARFLLAARAQAGGRQAARGLAGLAGATARNFARRLTGLRAASAPFLWDNVLGAGGVLARDEAGWEVRLNRPPLDVLLSLSRLAEGQVTLPGGRVRLSRVAS